MVAPTTLGPRAEVVEIDVVPESGRKRGDRRLAVSGPVKAAVDRRLNAPPEGLEESEDDERRGGDRGPWPL